MAATIAAKGPAIEGIPVALFLTRLWGGGARNELATDRNQRDRSCNPPSPPPQLEVSDPCEPQGEQDDEGLRQARN
jgi:hypothetical protein